MGIRVRSGRMTLGTTTRPAALTADVNDYAPAGLVNCSRLYVDPGGAARNVTGLAGGSDGDVIWLFNISTTAARNLVLKHQSASSAAANRFVGANLADVTVRPGGSTKLVYDGTAGFWRILEP